MEMFGGAADTSRILVKRCNAVSGINFDLTCGFNLRDSKHVQLLFLHVRNFEPVVIVMAPPCTGLKDWAGINAQINPHGHAISVENSKSLGRPAARIASGQLGAGRHFTVENLQGSELGISPRKSCHAWSG
jgi:hypothetical protein